MGTRISVSRHGGDVVGNSFFSGVVGSIEICREVAKGLYSLTA
jgi:hypothetical protein